MDIDLIRQFSLSLPGVTEDIKWGNDLVFSVGEKMFCVASLESPLKFSFKVPDEEFETYCQREGFIPAPYLARAKWVLLTDTGKIHKKEIEDLIKGSYELIVAKLPKKTRKELGL